MSIDWMKPLYDQFGERWHVLRKPDGDVWSSYEGRIVYRDGNEGSAYNVNCDGEVRGRRRERLSNTPLVPDWSSEMAAYSGSKDAVFKGQFVRIRYGIRNGKPFAEVAE